MPIYEYKCQSCEHQLEKLQRMSDPVLTDCPECGKSSLRRLVSAPGFRLKGGGWYETDFKDSNKRNLAESDSAGDKKAESNDKDTKSSESGDKKAASKDSAKPDSTSTATKTKDSSSAPPAS